MEPASPRRAANSAPTPAEIYSRAVAEGDRRLGGTLLELATSGFNAGSTIVFGILALGMAHSLVEPRFGNGPAKLAGSAAFGMGLAFLVASRSELFSENFFDPIASAFDRGFRSVLPSILRLWGVVLACNFAGGAVLILIATVEGVLPAGTDASLRAAAEEIAAKPAGAAFANAVLGGALVALLSFLLQAVDLTLSRIVLAYLVGFLLSVVPLAHVVVTVEHLLFGALLGSNIGGGDIAMHTATAIAGNMVGGVGLVAITHIAQARASG